MIATPAFPEWKNGDILIGRSFHIGEYSARPDQRRWDRLGWVVGDAKVTRSAVASGNPAKVVFTRRQNFRLENL